MLNINAWLHIIMTGDFIGSATTGVEEDNPVVAIALALHALLFG